MEIGSDVLIVNDDPDTRRILKLVIESKFNVPTRLASDGIEALKALNQNAPRLIILDLMMPNLDGFEVLRCLQTWRDLKHVPVVVVTASDFEDLTTITREYPVYFLKGGLNIDDFTQCLQPILN